MAVKTITVGTSSLTVQDVYAFQYNFGEGKEVLRVSILKADHDYATIAATLEAPATDIIYKEDSVEVCPYKGYTRDFKCAYANGTFSVEITKVTQAELDIKALQASVDALTLAQLGV